MGDGQGTTGREAFRWENGVMTGLGRLPGHSDSVAEAVSGNGSIVVGASRTGFWNAFRWEAGTMQQVGGSETILHDITLDGSVGAGEGNGAGWSGKRPY